MNDLSRETMRERLGNIDRIRDLLFGYEIQEYQKRFENCERRLEKIESEFTQFQTEMNARLEHLQSDLSTEIHSAVDSLEKKLRYLTLTTQNETSNFKQELKSLTDRNSGSIDSLYKDVEAKTNSVRDELTRTKQTLQEDVRLLRERIFTELEQKFDNLKDAKISRAELAEFLFELCFKVKGAETFPELKEAEETLAKAELLLPE
ncbi:hypothetical protein [Myxosarcina sp. GI1]|uniref:hypothetical protein n=1 Tax=Myxosarcina sp. GI1 TaxID=1541065 RepID=UPI0005617F17|nr:hypothetical protein [Myxosarcina sp. GI1]